MKTKIKDLYTKSFLIGIVGWMIIAFNVSLFFIMFLIPVRAQEILISVLVVLFFLMAVWIFVSLVGIVLVYADTRLKQIIREDNSFPTEFDKKLKHKAVAGLIINVTYCMFSGYLIYWTISHMVEQLSKL